MANTRTQDYASLITSTVTGTPSSSTFLRGDGSWTTIPPQGITYHTANGSLSLLDPVIIKPDNSVSKPNGRFTTTVTNRNGHVFTGITVPASPYSLGFLPSSVASDPKYNTIITLQPDIGAAMSNSNAIVVHAASVSRTTGGLTWGSVPHAFDGGIGFMSGNKLSAATGIVYNAVSNNYIALWTTPISNFGCVFRPTTLYAKVVTLTGITPSSTGSTVRVAQADSMMGPDGNTKSAAAGSFGYCYDETGKGCVAVYQINGSRYPAVAFFYATATQVSVSAQTVIESVSTGVSNRIRTAACYSATAGKTVIAYQASGNKVNLAVVSVSSNVPSVGALTTSTIFSGANSYFTLVSDERRGKILLMGNETIEEYSISGTTLVAGNVQSVNTSIDGFSANAGVMSSAVWDNASNTIFVLNTNRNSSGATPAQSQTYREVVRYNYDVSRYQSMDTGTINNSYINGLSGIGGNPAYNNYVPNGAMVKVGDSFNYYIAYTYMSDGIGCTPYGVYNFYNVTYPKTSNMNADGYYYGVSGGNYNAGDTASVYYRYGGGIINTTNLLPNTNYYLESSGDITSNTANTEAFIGTSVSSKQFIVR